MKKTAGGGPNVRSGADGRALALIRELRRMGVNTENFLYLAAEAEKKVRAIPRPRNLVVAMEGYGGPILFAPSVLHELARAAAIARGRAPGEEKGDGKSARMLLARVFRALSSAGETARLMEDRERAREVLILARAVQSEAERLAERFARLRTAEGKPSYAAVAQARQHVAEEAGLSVGAMQQRIRRTQADFPDADWPAIMPRAPKNPRP
jgi:hypothetical protein